MKFKKSNGCNGILNLFKYLKLKNKNQTFTIELLEDLVQSSLITIFIYLLMLILFYYLIQSNKINDPSANIPFKCIPNKKEYSSNMIQLVTFVNSILNTTNHKYFICYRTLFELLKLKPEFHDKNSIDLCIYDDYLNPTNIESNLFNSLITSNFNSQLDLFKQQNSNFDYYLDRLLGYYHFKLDEANLYLYMFVNSVETKYEFESIRRTGYLYLQFDYLNKMFSSQKLVTHKLPIYMIDNELFKTNIANNYLPFPNDVYSFLMHSYPNDWFKYYVNCSN